MEREGGDGRAMRGPIWTPRRAGCNIDVKGNQPIRSQIDSNLCHFYVIVYDVISNLNDIILKCIKTY